MLEPIAKRPRTRWVQFSLRGILGFSILAALVMGVWSYWHHRIRLQREAVVQIQDLQKQLTKSSGGFIQRGVTQSFNPTPWWLRLGGEKSIPVTTGVSFDLHSDKNYHLDRSGITDGDLQLLRVFPYLYVVTVPRSDVGDDGLSWVKPLRRLRRLDLSHTKVTDEDLAALAGLPDLETLDLSGLKITAAGFEHLSECPQLKTLTLEGLEFGEAEVEALAKLQALEKLLIRSDSIDRLHLHSLPQLKTLTVQSFHKQFVGKFDRLPSLLNLEVAVSVPGNLERLEVQSAVLESLSLVVPRQLNSIAQSPPEIVLKETAKLRTVEIHCGDWSDDWAAQLSQCQSIEYLTLTSTPPRLGDEALRELAKLPNLRRLLLEKTLMTDEGCEALSKCASLQGLSFEAAKVTEVGIGHLAKLPNLLELNLRGARSIGDVGPAFVPFPSLERLKLRNCHFEELTLSPGAKNGLAKLTNASISDCRAQRISVRDLPALQHLSIEESRIAEVEVRRLLSLTWLQVNLGQRQTLDRFVLEGLPQLASLWIKSNSHSGAMVPADAFQNLREFKLLRSGKLSNIRMPPEAIEDLLEFEEATGVQL